MWSAERLRHSNAGNAEALSVVPPLVEVNKADPRTTAQFLDDTLRALLLAPFQPHRLEAKPDRVNFLVERPTDRRGLDDEIALALHRFYGYHGEALKNEGHYSFMFHEHDLKTALDDTRELLEINYGISDDIDTSLFGSSFTSAWMTKTHRWTLPAICLQATKRALLIKRYNELPGNVISKRKEQRTIIEELRRYPEGELEYITR